MNKKGYFISIDWGTSNFRLRLVNKDTLDIIESQNVPNGVRELFLKWESRGGDRLKLFISFLQKQINQIDNCLAKGCEIIISGMASSSIGMYELPCSPLPFYLNGSNLNIIPVRPPQSRYIIQLISGLYTESDVIRGEEVQMIGLTKKINLSDNNIFILPGTHSKHFYCEENKIVDFDTYMTGELFQTICNFTILKNSLEEALPNAIYFSAFDEGVNSCRANIPLLNSMFKIRAWDLMKKRNARENYFYLSGILIGQELTTLHNHTYKNIYLCAIPPLDILYMRAIETLGFNAIKVQPKEVEMSVVRGQAILMQQKGIW